MKCFALIVKKYSDELIALKNVLLCSDIGSARHTIYQYIKNIVVKLRSLTITYITLFVDIPYIHYYTI